MKKIILLSLFLLLFLSPHVFAQTGKITGTITDQKTGEALIGVNVLIEGSSMGAATDIDGHYTILNVSPGIYALRASMIGYSPQRILECRVNIDLNTEIDFALIEESIQTGEVVVVAQTPIVLRDVAASGVNLNITEIENLPVVSIQGVINLQAGIDGDAVRGGSDDEIVYQVNGITLRDGRNNTPYSNISLTSVEHLRIETGGFTAETGEARSGIVKVVTKEGSKEKYTFGLLGQYRGAYPKYFGNSPNDPNSYYLRPYLDDAVAWNGTRSGGWDQYTQNQYPAFDGWNTVSLNTLSNSNPADDLTPEAAQRLFLWQHRKNMEIQRGDYDVDMSFGGPVPVISKDLGGLRFFTSYKENRTMLLLPLSTDNYADYSASFKLTSDIMPGMKLMAETMFGQQSGTNTSTSGGPGLFKENWALANRVDYGNYTDAVIYSNAYFTPTTVDYNNFALKLTHAISSSTYYELILSSFASDYNTNPGRTRNLTPQYLFGNGYYVDEAPFGYYQGPSSVVNGSSMMMGSIYSQSRDSSKVRNFNIKFDYNTQIDKANEFKTGFEFKYTHNKVDYALRSQYAANNRDYEWTTFPIQGAFYIQDKLEFEAMVATIGVRLDYSDPNSKWYDYGEYEQGFAAVYSATRDDVVKMKDLPSQLTVSPRLGIAFPISVNSKLFFNYGHFNALPIPSGLYLQTVEYDGRLERIANPEAPFERTIQYEIGYEHNLLDQYLLRLTGYYKDITNEAFDINYINNSGTVNYIRPEPIQYRDIRGFEFELTKNRGNWFQGFFNYTYMVSTSGRFGWGRYYQSSVEQGNYISDLGDAWYKQAKPVPRPYARLNIDLFTPDEFGPKFMDMYILEGFRANILSSWKAGSYYSWAGEGGISRETTNNLQWLDYYNMNLRLSKKFDFGMFNLVFYMEIDNLFNSKRLSSTGFSDYFDERDYFKSLHLKADIVDDKFGYVNIPGNDKPGDYRKTGTPFTPIKAVTNLNAVSSPTLDLIYYDASQQRYFEFNGTEWSRVGDKRMDKLLKDKAYIDMPNFGYFTFLNPRDILYGIKLNIAI